MFGIKTDRAGHAEDLKVILGGLKGPLMKVAQFLSTVPDALPAEYAAELAQLQANAPRDGLGFRAPPHGRRAGAGLAVAFSQVSARTPRPRPVSGRCIARRCRTAAMVACKLQYPDMASTVEADLRQLKLAMAVYHRMDSAIQQDEIYKELAERLREELDYAREAAQMRLYGLMLANEPDVHVPAPVPDYSTERLLTMTWLDGRALMRRLEEEPPQEERNRIAEALFRAWYVPFYRYGVIHGDPHLGNYQVRAGRHGEPAGFRRHPRVPGAVRARRDRSVTRRCATTTRTRRTTPMQTWGFTDLSAREDGGAERVGALPLRAADGGPRAPHPGDRRSAIRPRGGAERVHAGLKRTGGRAAAARIRADGSQRDRAGRVFLRLGAELNWSRMFHELIEDFDTEQLAPRQAAALAEAGVPRAPCRGGIAGA